MKTEKAIRDHIAECLHRIEVIKENMDSKALDKETCEHNISNLKENILALEEYLEYQKIGTVAELRDLKKRDTAKKPDLEGDGCDKDGNIIYDTWICPNCGERYEIDYGVYNFCPWCGQKIDESEIKRLED